MGVEGQRFLVDFYRALRLLLHLIDQSEVKQDQFGLRVQLERLLVIGLCLVKLVSCGVDLTEIIIPQDRAGTQLDQLVEHGNGLLKFALLSIESAEVQIRLLALGGARQHRLVDFGRLFFPVGGRQQPGQQQLGLVIVRLLGDHLLAMLQGFSNLAFAHVERRQAQA